MRKTASTTDDISLALLYSQDFSVYSYSFACCVDSLNSILDLGIEKNIRGWYPVSEMNGALGSDTGNCKFISFQGQFYRFSRTGSLLLKMALWPKIY